MNSHSTTVHDTITTSEWIDIRIITTYLRSLSQDITPRDARQWVNWRYERTKDGKRTKVPKMLNGRNAKTNDPKTWSTFADVMEATSPLSDRNFDGVGFMFTEEKKLLGIDLDKCIVNASVSPEIAALIAKARTYTEVSPSRTGLHLLFKLSSPLKLVRNKSGNFEAYTEKLWFTYTGLKWFESYPLRTITPEEALEILKMIGYPWQKNPRLSLPQAQHTEIMPALLDSEILRKMFASKNGAKIKALYEGDTSAHGGDDSVADAALCSHLAFWTGKDAARIDSIFRTSKLFRNKWDEMRGELPYGKKTINFAIENCVETYSMPVAENKSIDETSSVPLSRQQQKVIAPLVFTHAPDLLAMNIPPVEWQIDRIFAKGTLNMISAPPYQFKSMMSLRFAMSVAHGRSVFGVFDTMQSNVLMVEEEDTIAMVKERYQMLLEDGEPVDGVFFAIDTGRKIDVDWAEEIIKKAEAVGAGFVILDSLRSLHLENENDSQKMQPVVDTLKLLTRKGITVLFTHHHRKGQPGIPGEQSENGMDMARGSSAITAAVHGHITVQEKKIGGSPHLIIHQPKLKAAKKPEPFMLRIAERLEPKHMSFDYVGLYDAELAAADAMAARLLLHFREHQTGYFTRKRLAELGFATSAGDQTLRTALNNLVEKQQLEGKKYSELDAMEQMLVPDDKTPANTMVYRLAGEKEITSAENNIS